MLAEDMVRLVVEGHSVSDVVDESLLAGMAATAKMLAPMGVVAAGPTWNVAMGAAMPVLAAVPAGDIAAISRARRVNPKEFRHHVRAIKSAPSLASTVYRQARGMAFDKKKRGTVPGKSVASSLWQATKAGMSAVGKGYTGLVDLGLQGTSSASLSPKEREAWETLSKSKVGKATAAISRSVVGKAVGATGKVIGNPLGTAFKAPKVIAKAVSVVPTLVSRKERRPKLVDLDRVRKNVRVSQKTIV